MDDVAGQTADGPAGELRTFRASDGYRFYYRHFAATGRPRGRLIFVHGIRSHGGWYERSCGVFAAAGYEVEFLDRRGGGLNTAHRGDTPNFRRLIDDIGEFVRDLRGERPGLPIVLAGISWGGKLAVGVQYRWPRLMNGLVLLCPGLVPKVAPPFVQRAGIFRARLRWPDKFFPIPLNEPDLFTASRKGQQFIAAEPRGLREATARFLFSSFSLDIYLRRAGRRVNLPTLLLLADQDRIIDNARTRAVVEAFPAADKTVIEYRDTHHTLEFEPEGHPWSGDVLSWIEKRFA